MNNVELAQEHLEHARHRAAGDHQAHDLQNETRLGAILVAVLASLAVLVEMGVNDTMITYLANHISASDSWAEYQAKSVRRTIYQQSAAALEAAGGHAAQAEAARREAERMRSDPGHDGMEQLTGQARGFEEERTHELRLHGELEWAARGLQIGVVLVGLAMAARLRWLLLGGAALGGVSAVYALLAELHLL